MDKGGTSGQTRTGPRLLQEPGRGDLAKTTPGLHALVTPAGAPHRLNPT